MVTGSIILVRSAPARIRIGQGDNARKGHFKTQSDKLGKGVGDSPPSWAVLGY